jgi:glycosyltransferase involved in cell wall biosynthesis
MQVVPPEIGWELIIVDNASTDDTTVTAGDIWGQTRLPGVGFSILGEAKAGKQYALVAGVRKAKFDYVVICDDDNWLNQDYLHLAFKRMQSDVRIGAAGGQGIAVADVELPDWFEKYQHGYAVGRQNPASGNIFPRNYLWGAGMVFRKSGFQEVYSVYSPFLTGPKNNSPERIGSEDVEFCMRLQLAGYYLYFDENLIYRHYLPGWRLTKTYCGKLFNAGHYERRILYLYTSLLKIRNLTWPGKTGLLFASLLRFAVSKFSSKGRWHTAHEAALIYLITGIAPVPVPKEVSDARDVYLALSGAPKVFHEENL